MVQRVGCSCLVTLTEQNEKHRKHLLKPRVNAGDVVVHALVGHIKDPVLLAAGIQLMHRLVPHATPVLQKRFTSCVIKGLEYHIEDERIQEIGLLFLSRTDLDKAVRADLGLEIASCLSSPERSYTATSSA